MSKKQVKKFLCKHKYLLGIFAIAIIYHYSTKARLPSERQLREKGNFELILTQNGTASWYGIPFHGRKTASGEYYDMYALTAAHKTVELGTFAKVTNKKNGKSVVVKINDRGPYVKGRIIDLSKAAAKEIGMVQDGLAEVKIEVWKKKR